MGQMTVTVAKRVDEFLAQNRDKIAKVSPQQSNIERMMRLAVQAVRDDKYLAKCTTPSICLSVIRAAMMGVEPNSPLGEGYLVPYGDQCQLIIGYRGLINMARRSGVVTELYAHCVHEHDEFWHEYGNNPVLHHRPPKLGKPRGEIIGVYAVCKMRDGAQDFEVMDIEEINKVRNMAKGAKSPSSPWNQWFGEMARKTAIRRLAKRLPMSIEMAQAVEHDNRTSMGEVVDNRQEVIETTGIEIPSDDPMEGVEDPTKGGNQ